jgi:hypothetical protein
MLSMCKRTPNTRKEQKKRRIIKNIDFITLNMWKDSSLQREQDSLKNKEKFIFK